MAYIGNTTQVANSSYRIVDDISSGFNGVTTSFAFRVSGTTPIPFPLNPQNCIISVNNVLLKPDVTTAEGFWFSGANIVFKVAPTSGHKFWGVILAGADYVTAGSLNPDGVAVAPSVTFYSSTGTGLFLLGANTLGISTGGAQRLAINGSGAIGIGGTSFGTSGQVLASNGSGAAPSWQAPLTGASISIGDTSAVVSDTGTDGAFTVTTDGSAKLTINNFGAFGIGGSSFGTSGQIFTSGGAGSAPTWQTPAVVSTISVGNTNATVTDTGTNGTFTVTTENAARLTINSSGAFGVGGNNFGTSGQILTSNGSTAVPSWQAAPAGASILVGNTSATVTDTGIDGAFTVVTEANTRLIINSSGAFGLGGSNFGTSGQVLTSNGSTAVPSWQTTTNTSIAVGNTSATVTDTGAAGTFTVTTEGVSRLTVSSTGLVSLSGNLAVTGTTTLTGIPTAPTADLNTNTTQLATTAFVATAISSKANLASPTFTGTPLAPTAALNTNTTQLATTAFVAAAVALKANLASPDFTGTPTAPTATAGTNTTQLATTAFVTASPTFTGTPLAPTAIAGTSTTQLATTAFVAAADALKANLASPTFTGSVTLPSTSVVSGPTDVSSVFLEINTTTLISGYKTFIAFSKNSVKNWQIGTDNNASSDNNFFFYDDVVNLERARISSSGYLKCSPGGTYQNITGTHHEFHSPTGVSPLLLRNTATASGKYWTVGPRATDNTVYVTNQDNTGVAMSDGGLSWSSFSDERLKDIIEPINNALNKISTLRTVIGKLKTDPVGTRRSFLIAQDVQAVFPEAVNVLDSSSQMLGIAYTDLIPLLTAALKESLVRIQELEYKVTALEAA